MIIRTLKSSTWRAKTYEYSALTHTYEETTRYWEIGQTRYYVSVISVNRDDRALPELFAMLWEVILLFKLGCVDWESKLRRDFLVLFKRLKDPFFVLS